MAFIEMDFASGGGGSLKTYATLNLQTTEEDLKGKPITITLDEDNTYVVSATFGSAKEGGFYKASAKLQSIGNYTIECDEATSNVEVTDISSSYNVELQLIRNVWTNSNPTSSFSPQTITLDLTKINKVRVTLRESTSSGNTGEHIITVPTSAKTYGVGSADYIARYITVNTNSVVFGNGYSNASKSQIDQKYAIPISIDTL